MRARLWILNYNNRGVPINIDFNSSDTLKEVSESVTLSFYTFRSD